MPISVADGASPFGGLLVGVGCVLIGSAAWLLWRSSIDGKLSSFSALSAAGLLLIVAIVVVVLGIREFTLSRKVLIDGSGVTASVSWLLFNSDWRASLADYRGLVLREIYGGTASGEHTVRALEIELAHERDSSKSVVLRSASLTSRGDAADIATQEEFRLLCASWHEALDLPLFEVINGRFVQIEPSPSTTPSQSDATFDEGELSKASVLEISRNGRIDTVYVRLPQQKSSPAKLFIALVVAVASVAYLTRAPEGLRRWLAICVITMAVIGILLASLSFRLQGKAVAWFQFDADTIRTSAFLGEEREFRRADLVKVHVDELPIGGSADLYLITKQGRMKLIGEIPLSDITWLRNRIERWRTQEDT